MSDSAPYEFMQRTTSISAEGRVKLRSACDACSVAKVKCDKKNPCERCRINGFKCSHSPSRRHGKQSWARRIAEYQQQQQQQQQQYLHSSLVGPRAPAILMSPFMQMPQHCDPNSSTSPTIPLASPDDTMLDLRKGEGQLDQPSLSRFELGKDLDFLSQWCGVDSGINLASSAAESSFTPTTSESETSHSLEPQLPPIHDCEEKAFTTLHSLHFCTMNHSERPAARTQGIPNFSRVSNRMPPLDKVLFFNRVAISTLRELLECPCAQQSHIALMYITILSKALLWYRLAVNPQYESLSPTDILLDSPGSRSNPSISASSTDSRDVPGQPKNLTDRAVKAKMIQIGIFDLEEEDEKLLMRSVLLREVKKVEATVEFLKTLGATKARDEYGDEEQPLSTWYAVGGVKLEKEVQDTLKQVKEMGVRKSSGT